MKYTLKTYDGVALRDFYVAKDRDRFFVFGCAPEKDFAPDAPYSIVAASRDDGTGWFAKSIPQSIADALNEESGR